PLVAQERGMEVREERRAASPDFRSLVTVTAVSGGAKVAVAGTVFGGEYEPRLVSALGYKVEIALAPRMLFVVNDDRPGRIGRIGTILGEAGVNIADMAVSRNRQKSRALMVLTLDDPIPPEVLERVEAEPGLLDPRAIVLERGDG
ncbi:MAG TPA: ACT domain-containing protein, partial [Gaiellaceae bacterium]|nr:ACT domain-containing protein [Gaiellaceae bacterium]